MRQRRALDPHPHAVDAARDAELGAGKPIQRLQLEIILLRPEDEADRLLGRRVGRLRQVVLGAFGRTGLGERHAVAGTQRPAVEPAEAAAYVGRGAAQHGGDRDAAADREIAAARLAPEHDAAGLASAQSDALPGRDRARALALDLEPRAGAPSATRTASAATSSVGPAKRISSAAAPGGLPASAFASARLTGSSAPETGTPMRW